MRTHGPAGMAAWTAALALGLALTGTARAGVIGEMNGSDPVARTLTIDDGVYRFTENTVFVDLEGRTIDFEAFPRAFPGLGFSVWYELVDDEPGRTLRRVELWPLAE